MEGEYCLWVIKSSWKEPCYHQLHVALGSSRAAAPADTNLMDTRPINDGYYWTSFLVMMFWL
jgi:hypothetical protein